MDLIENYMTIFILNRFSEYFDILNEKTTRFFIDLSKNYMIFFILNDFFRIFQTIKRTYFFICISDLSVKLCNNIYF